MKFEESSLVNLKENFWGTKKLTEDLRGFSFTVRAFYNHFETISDRLFKKMKDQTQLTYKSMKLSCHFLSQIISKTDLFLKLKMLIESSQVIPLEFLNFLWFLHFCLVYVQMQKKIITFPTHKRCFGVHNKIVKQTSEQENFIMLVHTKVFSLLFLR